MIKYTNIFPDIFRQSWYLFLLHNTYSPFSILCIYLYNASKYLIGGKGIQSQDMVKISENMLVYLHIQNVIFVNFFGIRRNYSFYFLLVYWSLI